MDKTGVKLLIFISICNKQYMSIEGKTWSGGSNSFSVNVTLELSNNSPLPPPGPSPLNPHPYHILWEMKRNEETNETLGAD